MLKIKGLHLQERNKKTDIEKGCVDEEGGGRRGPG